MPATGETGRVYLVGAGPGDPGLLTLRGAEVLRAADVLLYDALAGGPIVALAPPACERIFVGKRAGEHAMAQAEIEALMIAKAREGRRVVRLKGGDPFVFGRGGEEAEALHAAGVAFEVVPGISSALAAPAYAGIPVTHRAHNTSFTVLTGHEDPSKPASTIDWAQLAGPQRVLVLLMATANLREIARQLLAQGVPAQTPVAAIADGTRPTQRTATGTLATIADEVAQRGIVAPAVIVVGDVVRLRDEIRWFDTSPLFGRRVLITRAGHQSDAFARALLERGAEPILAPAIAIEGPDDATAPARALDELHAHAWLAFTSQNGVDAFFACLAARGEDARAIASVKIAAIGERTAERLRGHGVRADLVPGAFISEEIARALIARTQPGDRVMIYRAQEARDALPRMLEDAERRPTLVPAYKTVVTQDAAFGEKVARADVLTFTSASTVHAFCSLLGGDGVTPARGKSIACIGPVTACAAREAGLTVDIVAQVYTTAGLLEALETHLGPRG
jgi:uroporphyrinogen III methyltransferase / synthase